MRVYHSPYSSVDWTATARIKAQHHDHNRARLESIRAYDDAGYQAIVLMDYSGAPSLSYALTYRLWTPEHVGVTSEFTSTLKHLQFFIPGAEEVGIANLHMTSPFLTEYIEDYDSASAAVGAQSGTGPASWQYRNPQELVDKINTMGGFAMLAHPWNSASEYAPLKGYHGMEIYSAYAEAKRRQGDAYFTAADRNAQILALWDRHLAGDQSLVGISVNDHFGPDSAPDSTDPDVRDSGKIIVYAASTSLDDYRAAFERGALVAVKDVGRSKDQYPTVRAISVQARTISIDTDGEVRWIANGVEVGKGPVLDYVVLARSATYLRAEVSNADGSTVYTQAFSVRPVGDANGDGLVDDADKTICASVNSGADRDHDHVAACANTG